MGKEIRESGDATFYSGSIEERHDHLLARLDVGRDCEAELAVLLMSAARRGIIRLDRIRPFLDLAVAVELTQEKKPFMTGRNKKLKREVKRK